jgi:hypothetical protein
MDSKTNIYVLLKNLEAFVNAVPINPKSPKRRAWERNRAEMKKALKETNRILMKPGYLEGLEVFVGPFKGCGKVPSKQVFLEQLQKVLHKTVREQFKPDRRPEPVRKKR